MPRKVLEELSKFGTLSEEGKAWLVEVLDPFHDEDLSLVGYPDALNASTVIQLVKRQMTIVAPSVANWDASIAMFPTGVTINSGQRMTMSQQLCTVNANTAPSTNWGGIVANTGPAGTTLWPTATASAAGTTTTGGGMDPNNYTRGNYRILGMAFEVVNTTSPMYMQGQACVWRKPFVANDEVYAVSGLTGNDNGAYSVTRVQTPPATVDEAMLLYGSRSWAASEGAYVVSRLNSTLNPCSQPTYKPVLYSPNDYAGSNPTSYCYGLSPFTLSSYHVADKIHPFDLSGVTFTGLSPQTTLVVNARWIIERCPTPIEGDLVVLANPSPCYNPTAIELMTRAMCNAPPGVMLKENPLGEWFRSLLKSIENYAPRIGSALGTVVPGAQMVGAGLGLTASAARQLMRRSMPKPTLNSNSNNMSKPPQLSGKDKKGKSGKSKRAK